MAYGKGDKNVFRRSIPSGKTTLDPGMLTAGKMGDLLVIRRKFLAAANSFVDAAFLPEPLASTRNGEDLHAVLTALQKNMEIGFNKAYVEKARLAVPPAIAQVEQKYFKRLYGRLLNCAAKTDEEDPAKRQYLSVPETIQDKVTASILESLERKINNYGYGKTIDLVRQVVIRKSSKGLTGKEAMIVRAIHRECLAKYGKPVFGSDDRFVCQINLDYRVIRNDSDPVARMDNIARLLVDRTNRKYYHFLEISNPAPHGKPIRIPVAMSARTLKRFDKLSSVSSLSLVINPDSVLVRAIISRPAGKADIGTLTHIIGRDFGMVNTASLSVIRIDDQIDEKKLKRISEFTREEALDYLKNYSYPNDNVVERIRFNGRSFLRNINDSCKRIEKLKSQIDTGYNNPNKLKSIICGYLGLDEREQFAEGQDLGDPYIRRIHEKFFRLLHHLVEMKKKRLSLYKKIAGVKKSWFGYLSNQETILARKYHAAIVREDLSILAREKNGPGYKGRTFNKMINNGSKGQYIRRASDKLQWDGIPEVVIPSYHTSSSCTVHSLVDASMRNGETFFCPRCGVKEHADSHAADTIGNYILLRPNIAKQVTLLLPRDRQSSGNLLVGSPKQ